MSEPTINKNFECELSYMKGEEGSADQKQVKEYYIFRAVNYTDAEKKLHEFCEEREIKNFQYKITPKKIHEFIDELGQSQFFLAKTSFVTTTNSGKEKQNKENVLVNAFSIDEAMKKLKERFQKFNAVVTKVIGINESQILEVVE